jgi:1,2-diacylglycerol-3-alpha-glucose alpha-1,2-glucosyltransferase
MKVFVHFQPRYLKDVYEGMRLRKNIKGALELANIEIAKNSIDNYDVAHFLSVADETKINDAIELGKPVVFSALMCESDPVAKLTEITREGFARLSGRALRVLNRVSLVIVPNATGKKFLLEQGVKSKIVVLSPGVNIARFEKHDQLEGDLFYRYFRFNKGTKIVVAFGQYDNRQEIYNIVEIAKKCPGIKFLYFGQAKRLIFLPGKIRRLLRRSPKNLRFNPIIPEDVYRSVMMNADVFLAINPHKYNAITMLDAVAAKCQIIGLGPVDYDAKVFTKEYAYTSESISGVAKLIDKYFANELPSKSAKAYSIAKAESLTEIGKKLEKIYADLLKTSGQGGKKHA